MIRDVIAPLGGLVAGVVSAMAVYGLVYSNLGMAVLLGSVYALAVWLLCRRWSVWTTSGSLWGGAIGGVLTGASLFGVQFVPDLSDGAGLAVGLLVIGTGAAMAGLGVELALEAPARVGAARRRTVKRVRFETRSVVDDGGRSPTGPLGVRSGV